MILRKTKFKVTFWYVITVALTLLIFSGIFYFLTLSISERAIDRHQRRIDMAFELNSDPGPGKGPGAQRSNAQLALDQAKQEGLKQLQKSLFIEIVALDIVIILITAFFGYYIAGKSLSPVEVMIEKQKDFVSNAAHELKTPLTAMKAELEVAMRDKRLTRAEISEVFSSTIEEINRLAALIGAFLNQSKYEKLNAATYKLTSLNSIVENVVAKNFILANSKRISVEMDLQDIDVKCDRASIYELVSVLLDNAIKYAFEDTKITITLSKVQKNAVFKIHNFGDHIETSEIDKIFERFYQSEKSRNKNINEGYGVGLSIAAAIVKNHKGEIFVSSSREEGTTFTFKIPL